MIYSVGLTVSMCMLTESVQLCTCISALYQISGSLFYQQKGLKPQKANSLLWINKEDILALLLLYNIHISVLCHHLISFTNLIWPVWKPGPKWNACTLLVCCWIHCLCLQRRCCVIEYYFLLYLNVKIHFYLSSFSTCWTKSCSLPWTM